MKSRICSIHLPMMGSYQGRFEDVPSSRIAWKSYQRIELILIQSFPDTESVPDMLHSSPALLGKEHLLTWGNSGTKYLSQGFCMFFTLGESIYLQTPATQHIMPLSFMSVAKDEAQNKPEILSFSVRICERVCWFGKNFLTSEEAPSDYYILSFRYGELVQALTCFKICV